VGALKKGEKVLVDEGTRERSWAVIRIGDTQDWEGRVGHKRHERGRFGRRGPLARIFERITRRGLHRKAV